MPRPTAHQPSLRSPRGGGYAACERNEPGCDRCPGGRNVQGGSANQKARMPQTMPRIAIVRGSVSLRTSRRQSRRATACSRGRLRLGRGAAAQQCRCLPDVDDEELGADEEDHERLDHRREVDRERGLEDLWIELAGRGADLGAAKGCEEDADGLVRPRSAAMPVNAMKFVL